MVSWHLWHISPMEYIEMLDGKQTFERNKGKYSGVTNDENKADDVPCNTP